MHDLYHASIYHSLMAIKLDMEQAYDCMYWSFLEKALKDFGFHPCWISWIMACIERLSFTILINETPFEFFYSTVGLQQGCPPSPYLFIIYVDALSRALHAMFQGSVMDPYIPAPEALLISYLLFAYYCLLMSRATILSVVGFKRILKHCCLILGEKVILLKFVVHFSPRTPVRH